MNLQGLRTGEKVLGLSGILLLISLFMPWWSGIPGHGELVVGGLRLADTIGLGSTWNAFEGSAAGDVLWVATAIGAVVVLAIAATRTNINSPIALSGAVTMLGAISLILVLLQFIEPPAEMNRDYGLFIGMFAIIGIVVGGWQIMSDEGSDVQ